PTVPRVARLLRPHVHRARLPDPGAAGRAARGAPGARGAPAPHAVPGRAAADGAEARRRPDVSGADAALARALPRRRGSPLPARRPRPDQPDLGIGAIPHLRLDERGPARLVPRLADRRAPPDAG